MSLQDRKFNDRTSTGTPSEAHRRHVADAASWTQVVLAGVGVVVAIVAAIFGYFAWIQPHSPASSTTAEAKLSAAPAPVSTTQPAAGTGSTTPAAATPVTPVAGTVALASLAPAAGGANIHAGGGGLVMPCASGQSDDRQRTVEYDLLRRYAGLETDLTVSKAPDADSKVQIKIFADGREAANRTLKKGPASRLKVPLDGTEKLRIQLTCEFPDSEITLGNPALAHS
ncbi:hypothetical protein ACQPZX_30250 [Actinoplanes sp. CA-142083]|uniref:hypothetical protein n=1 Tax=Actinoplanes sp. CA-142083 TaxID=3239903 RepID=UPI003D8CE49D